MKKILALLGITAFSCGCVYALDMVCPVSKYNKTTHDNVYFMGTLAKGETLYYQSEKVNAAANGAFAINIPVKSGKNQVFLKVCKDGSCSFRQYYITKLQQPVAIEKSNPLIPIGNALFVTSKPKVILRSTPENKSINGISYLSAETMLIVDAKQGDYFRVRLTPTRYAWVSKADVTMVNAKPSLAEFYNVDDKTASDISLYRVAFSRNLPYEIIDNPDELVINIFNVAGMNDETLILRVSKNELIKYGTGFSNGDFTLMMKNMPKIQGQPLTGVKVVLDAGHGGQDKGASGMFRDTEKDYNLQVALKLKDELENQGAEVYLTRTDDYDLDVNDRVKIAIANDANIFVSIHMSAVSQGDNPVNNSGTTVSYYNNSALNLAQSVQKSVVTELLTKDNGLIKSDNEILRPSEYLGVNVDLCYLTNPKDSEIYRADAFAQKAAKGISDGIVKYISLKRGINQNEITSGSVSNNISESNLRAKKNFKFWEKFKKDKANTRKPVKVKAQKPIEQTDSSLKNESNIFTNWFKNFKKSTLDNTSNANSYNKEFNEEKPFLDTSVREQYKQEAIYTIDENDKKWYRPNGKKKRVKRPPREIKNDISYQEPVNIFASGDYEEPVVYNKPFKERCRDFFSKLVSYFYNGAKN